jgi:hypothetical protein
LPRRFEKSTNQMASGTARNSEMNSEPQTARIIRFQAMATSGCEATIEIGAWITSPEGRVRLMTLPGLNSMNPHPAA